MEMHQVRYFLAVARTLNFTRAADECNVTQPSLTRAVQKLEEELGGLLFRRERALTHLTDLGRLMLPHLERTLEAAQTAKQLARGVGKADVAPLNLGVANGLDTPPFGAVLRDLGEGLPGFQLSLTSGASEALIDQALHGALDVLVVAAPGEAPDRLERWPLFRDRLRFVIRADHPLARSDAVAVADLRDEVLIDCGGDGPALLRAAAAFEPRFYHRVTGDAALVELVRAGLGGGVRAGAEPGADGIVAIPFADAAMAIEVVIATIAGRRRSVAADAFVRAARARAWPDR